MMTDLLSAQLGPPAAAAPGDQSQPNLPFNLHSYLMPFLSPPNGHYIATPQMGFPVPSLASPPLANYHHQQHQQHQSPASPSQIPLYRYLKQQLQLPDKLELCSVSTSESTEATTAICVSCNVSQSTTFGPYGAKIGKSRQLLNADLSLKVRLSDL